MRTAPYPFNSPEEHEAAVWSAYHGKSPNMRADKLVPCASCGRYFRTTAPAG